MNKKILMALAVYICTICYVSPANSKNLVSNGGFEEIAGPTEPKGWSVVVTSGTKADLSFDATEKHNGRYSYRISVSPPGGRVILSLKKEAKGRVIPGKTYEISAWIKQKGLDYNQFFVAPAIQFNFKPKRLTPAPIMDLKAMIKDTKDWVKVSELATAPAQSDTFLLNIIITKGTVWIDDVSVKPVD